MKATATAARRREPALGPGINIVFKTPILRKAAIFQKFTVRHPNKVGHENCLVNVIFRAVTPIGVAKAPSLQYHKPADSMF